MNTYKQIDLKQIRTFITVTECQSISLASKELGVSQTSVTLQIQDLERNTRFKLFRRTYHGMELTEEGRVFYNRIKSAYLRFDYAISQINNYYKEQKNIVNIAIHYPYAVHEFPKILAKAKNIPVKIFNIHRQDAEERMIAGEIDIGIYPVYKQDPRLVYKTITSYKPMLIVGKENHLSTIEKIKEADLIGQNFIVIDRNLVTLDGFNQIYDNLSLSSSVFFENGNWDILIALVRQNIGISLVSELYMNENEKDIVYKDMSHLFDNMQYQILTTTHSITQQKVMEIISKIDKSFADKLYNIDKNLK
jgi:DNA-binding transcriptional LysR family regulator